LEPFPSEIHRELTSLEEALAIARRDHKPIFVHFYANWCGWCIKMEPGIRAAESEFAHGVVFVKVNVDDPRYSEFVSRYKSTPSLPENVFLRQDGSVITTVKGYMSRDQLAGKLKKISG
ncbi:MAG: thioredoxin family protein, partial [bacterium]